MRQAEAYVLMAALLDPIDHIEGQPPVVEFWIGNSRDRTGLTPGSPAKVDRSVAFFRISAWHVDAGARPNLRALSGAVAGGSIRNVLYR
jgi:hypothetical protein